MAGWVKDAHKVRFAKIYYAFHPHCGKEVKIVRSIKEDLIIQTPEGKRIGVPKWMTNKEVCLRIKQCPNPYCSHNSLKELRKMLLNMKG